MTEQEQGKPDGASLSMWDEMRPSTKTILYSIISRKERETERGTLAFTSDGLPFLRISQTALMNDTGLQRPTIAAAFRQLSEMGFIRKEHKNGVTDVIVLTFVGNPNLERLIDLMQNTCAAAVFRMLPIYEFMGKVPESVLEFNHKVARRMILKYGLEPYDEVKAQEEYIAKKKAEAANRRRLRAEAEEEARAAMQSIDESAPWQPIIKR